VKSTQQLTLRGSMTNQAPKLQVTSEHNGKVRRMR